MCTDFVRIHWRGVGGRELRFKPLMHPLFSVIHFGCGPRPSGFPGYTRRSVSTPRHMSQSFHHCINPPFFIRFLSFFRKFHYFHTVWPLKSDHRSHCSFTVAFCHYSNNDETSQYCYYSEHSTKQRDANAIILVVFISSMFPVLPTSFWHLIKNH